MNIAVCDDDIKTRDQLSELIKKQFPEGIVRCFKFMRGGMTAGAETEI